MIPYLDLKKQYHGIKMEIDAAIASVLENGQFVLGEEVNAFEKDFAAYCGTRHAVAVSTGTSALHLALVAAGIGPGDEVITTPLTFIATVAAILFTGAKPVLVDIDPFTLNIDASKVNEAVTKHTKAIIPVHLYGKPADTETLTEIAQKNKLIIIEDAAQAHGAEVRGRRVGGLGQMGCFSFYPGKNIGAYGEGGAVTTDDEEFAEKIRLLRDWGAKKKYYYDVKGFSFRMETLQGAILQVKLRHLEKWTEARRRLARYYDEQLKDVSVQIPSTPVGVRHVYHVYAILTDDRDRLQDYLTAKAIQTNIHYPVPVHLQKAYSDMGYRTGDFPIAERACARLLSLPLYPEMTETQVEEVATAVRQGVEKLSKES